MAFYNVPYKELLSSNISPTAKLLYLYLESWYSYCKKKNKPCTVYFSQLCSGLSLEINDIVNAARQLNEAKLTLTYPEKDAVLVSWMKTIDKEYY
ncbi:hypothetical protein PZS63_00735 [Klebsiella aerogenes]|uniref:hypothetical protein n=1 Tax=Klebsiella aerogenes TaxID=548 RepID=UPI002B264930|nr:hypothetical protein [Klebsiella aerogenes]MEA8782153.1 hypothetical protein [Klebsiella aerogenes]